jgi:hypothetical protein
MKLYSLHRASSHPRLFFVFFLPNEFLQPNLSILRIVLSKCESQLWAKFLWWPSGKRPTGAAANLNVPGSPKWLSAYPRSLNGPNASVDRCWKGQSVPPTNMSVVDSLFFFFLFVVWTLLWGPVCNVSLMARPTRPPFCFCWFLLGLYSPVLYTVRPFTRRLLPLENGPR